MNDEEFREFLKRYSRPPWKSALFWVSFGAGIVCGTLIGRAIALLF